MNSLRKEGYRGYFELDFLIDKKTGDFWLGELNPRITGASSMTNHAAFAHADAPLFLFHLLEFSKKKFDLDTTELNNRWANPDMIDSWSQMVIKHTEDSVDICTASPETGIYKMLEDGAWFLTALTITVARLNPRTRRFSCGSCSRATTAMKGPISAFL